MVTESVTKLAKRQPLRGESLPLDVIRELSNAGDLKEYVKHITQSERERIITFMRTFNSEALVAATFGVDRRTVERAVAHNRGILKSAKHARNAAVAGLAEDKAIETLRCLDVTKVPDERKGRLVKDLMDSAALANEQIKPQEEKKEENVMELIFRVKHRGQQHLPKPAQFKLDSESEADDALEAEFEEQKVIPGATNETKS